MSYIQLKKGQHTIEDYIKKLDKLVRLIGFALSVCGRP